MQGVFLHVLADTLGSVGVILSTLLIRWTGWTGWDPLASLFIAALIMASVLPLVTESAKVLALELDDGPVRAALTKAKVIPGVASYSAPRFWPKGEGMVVGSIHIQLAPGPGVNVDKVRKAVERTLKRGIPGLTEVVIQIEDGRFCACMTG